MGIPAEGNPSINKVRAGFSNYHKHLEGSLEAWLACLHNSGIKTSGVGGMPLLHNKQSGLTCSAGTGIVTIFKLDAW